MNFISTYKMILLLVWMNQSNLTIELSSSSQPEIRQGRVALYMKSGRGEMHPIYLMYFAIALDSSKQKF